MKFKLAPENEKLWRQTLRDIPKFLAGMPSGFRKEPRPPAASEREVRAARRAIHATQDRFARIIGVSVQTVKAWEAGRRKPEGAASKAIRLIRKDAGFAEVFEAA